MAGFDFATILYIIVALQGVLNGALLFMVIYLTLRVGQHHTFVNTQKEEISALRQMVFNLQSDTAVRFGEVLKYILTPVSDGRQPFPSENPEPRRVATTVTESITSAKKDLDTNTE